MRHVLDKAYDPYFDNTLEAVGESVHWGEPIVDAVARSLAEEMGLPPSTKIVFLGGEDHAGSTAVTTAHAGAPILSLLPYIYVQALKEPQPWCGLGFVAVLPASTPATSGDKEVGASAWWDPAELLAKLEDPA